MKGGLLKIVLFGIFIIALLLRVFSVIQAEPKKALYSDAKEYDEIAMHIVSGHGYIANIEGKDLPTTRRTPGYPLFLAGIYKVFGHSYLAVQIIQAILGALCCVIIFFITAAIYNNLAGTIAAFMAAVYKPFVSGFLYYGGSTEFISEAPYMFFISLSLLALILFIKKGDKKIAVLAGISIGLAVLIRPEFIIFPILLFFYLLYVSRFAVKTVIKRYFFIYFFMTLTMAPWVIRNYIVEGRFIPLSNYAGLVFYCGNNSLAKGGWAWPEGYSELYSGIKEFSDYEKNKIFFDKGLEFLKANPGRIPWISVKKVLVHWAPFELGLKMFNPYYAFILLFGAIGILFFRNKSVIEAIITITLLTTTLIAIIIYGDPRYRYPYEFCLIIFASLPIVKIFDAGFSIIKRQKIL